VPLRTDTSIDAASAMQIGRQCFYNNSSRYTAHTLMTIAASCKQATSTGKLPTPSTAQRAGGDVLSDGGGIRAVHAGKREVDGQRGAVADVMI